MSSVSKSSNPLLEKHRQKLDAILNLANPAFTKALTQEAVARSRRFIQGIRAYQKHPDRRDLEEAPVIWQDGTTKLRDYGQTQGAHTPMCLVIPSLINRFTILDLDFAPSFLRALAAQGIRPLVVDWGAPGQSEKNFTLSDYVTKRLFPILDFAALTKAQGKTDPSDPSSSSASSFHILGYCMGGLLALALAALRPSAVKTLTLMATPWDFHRPEPSMAAPFKELAKQLEPSLKKLGHLPVDVIQSLFAAMQPLQALTKFMDFAALDPHGMEARRFVLVEDWLNDGVPLTANVARECIGDWYGENFTAKTEWHIDGTIIDPKKIETPTYVIVPGRDCIVPPESALPLAKLLPHATLHEPMLGHIGMIAGKSAPHQVWAPLFHWLKEHG